MGRTVIGPGYPGAICRNASGIGRTCTGVSAGGRSLEFGSGSSSISRPDADNEYAMIDIPMIDTTIVRAHQHSAGAQKITTRTRRSAGRAAG